MEYTIEVLVDGKVEYTHDAKSTLTEEVTQYLLMISGLVTLKT